VQTAQIQSTLTPASGSARDLVFSVQGSAGTAGFTASDVATGYHTLILKLLDNGHLAIGAVEVVRIVKDQTTSGSLAFADVNQATGSLEVNLNPEMADPLEVSISGSATTKPANQSLALSAAVGSYADNVSYVWYVNGNAVSTGASYSFGDTWTLGYYRIDVNAFSADATRAGSASTQVQVVAAVATPTPSPTLTPTPTPTPTTLPFTMVSVPAGTFNNGTSDVTLSAFQMSATEVTQGQYQAVMGSNPSYFTGDTSRPVEMVSWYDALVFCNNLSIEEGLAPVYTIS
jgi:hypothetical protein